MLLAQVFWRPQLVWVVEPALFCAPAAVAVARLSRARAWLHEQDFEVDAAFDLGLLKGQRLRSMVAAAEAWLMRRFDVVSTISQRMHQRLLATADIHLLPQRADAADLVMPSKLTGMLASARAVVATAHVGDLKIQ